MSWIYDLDTTAAVFGNTSLFLLGSDLSFLERCASFTCVHTGEERNLIKKNRKRHSLYQSKENLLNNT